jgi:hypothetical protein
VRFGLPLICLHITVAVLFSGYGSTVLANSGASVDPELVLVVAQVSNQRLVSEASVVTTENEMRISQPAYRGDLKKVRGLSPGSVGRSVSFQYSCDCSKYRNGTYLLIMEFPKPSFKRYFARRMFRVNDHGKACLPKGVLDYNNIKINLNIKVKRVGNQNDGDDMVCFDIEKS